MNFLVTGGNGFIGSHTVDKLIELNHAVVVVDNNSAESNEKFYFNKKAKNYMIDVCDYEKLNEVMQGIDVVIHLAAESRIQPAILNPIKAAHVNVVGTCNVLQAARENGVDRVVYSSTSSGYGLKNVPPLREDMRKDCLNPYSVTKCAGEELCTMYTRLFGLKTITFRYFNVYGERQPIRGQYAPVVGLFLEQRKAKKPMTIVGDGKQRRDFTHVSDVVNANMLASFTDNPEVFGEIFNIGTGENISILRLAELIGTAYKFIPPRPAEARYTLADNSKALQMLNWRPEINFEDWVKKQLT